MAMNGVGAFFDGFNTAYDSVGRVARDAEIARIARAGVKPLPGQVPPQMARDIQAEVDADPSVAAAAAPQRFEFLGQQYDTAPDEATQTRGRQLAMAGVFEKYGDVGAGMGMRREVRRDQLADEEAKTAPLRRRQLELGVAREEQAAKDDGERRAAAAESQKWWDARLTAADGTKRAATPKDFTDFSQQRIYDLVAKGRLDEASKAYNEHNAQAFVQIQLQTANRKNDGEKALQALYQGNTQGVLDWYNNYAPDGMRATGVKFGKDGVATITRVGADGKPAAPLAFKGGTAELAASIQQGFDPNAMMQWQHQQFTEELQRRHLALAGGAAARDQARFDAEAPQRALGQRLANRGLQASDPNATPEQRRQARALLAEAKGPDQNAPAQVKLAQAMVAAGLRPDMKSALEFAMTAKDKSPDALRAEIYKTALTANMGDAKRAQATTEEAMRFLSQDQAPAAASAPTFSTAAEAEAAAKAGKIKSGDKIIVNGQSGTWR